MKNKSINRYTSFCKSLENLKKSRDKKPEDDMVLEATVQRFNLSFDLSWKVMKDILTEYMGILDFATGSPRDTLQTAFTNGIISDDICRLTLSGIITQIMFYVLTTTSFQNMKRTTVVC